MKFLSENFTALGTGLGRRLMIPVVLAIVVLMIPFAFALRAQSVEEQVSQDIVSHDESIKHLSNLEASARREQVAISDILLLQDEKSVDEFRQAVSDQASAFGDIKEHATNPDEVEKIEELEALHQVIQDDFARTVLPLFASLQNGTAPAEEAVTVRNKLRMQFGEITGLTDQIRGAFEADDAAALTEQNDARRLALEMLWGSMIAAIVTALFVASLSAGRIVRSVRRTSKASTEMARGDLSQRVIVEGRDELADMGRSFNDMADALERHSEQLENEKARMRSIHQSIGDGIIVIDRGGVIISVNPAAERFLGSTALELERTTNTGVPELQNLISENISNEQMTNCWEAKNCKKSDCPSHGSEDRRCWLQCGTFCYNQIQGTFKQKRDACERCDVFIHNAVRQFAIDINGEHYSTQIVPILDDYGQEEGRTVVLHAVTELLRTKEEAERSAVQLGVLNSVSRAAASSLELDTILSTSLASMVGGTMADAAFIHTEKPGSGELVLAASHGLDGDFQAMLARMPRGTGCPGHVLELDEPVLENDLRRLGDSARLALEHGFNSYVGAPLRIKKGTTGVVSLLAREPNAFLPEDSRLMNLVGNQIGMAVDNASLFNESVEHANIEQVKTRIIAALTSSLELNQAFDEFADEVKKLIDFDLVSIVVPAADKSKLVVLASQGWAGDEIRDNREYSLKNPVVEKVLKNKQTNIIDDLREVKLAEFQKLVKVGLRSMLNMPLTVKGEVIGALNLSSVNANAYSTKDAKMLKPIADQIALSLSNQKLFEGVAKAKTEWETTFDSVSEGIAIIDTNHKIVRLNKTAAEMVGSTVSELVGEDCFKIIHGIECQPEACPMDESAFGKSFPAKSEYESKDGRTLELIVDTMFDGEGKKLGAVHILRDVTEAKRMREQLIQSEKMVAVGQLVSGVAHEINNPLTGVAGYAQLLLSRDIDDSTRADAEAIYRESERATRIVRHLLSFARKHMPEKTATNINQILAESLELKAYDLKVNNIRIEASYDEDIPVTLVDPHQLKQVFLNLITNAEQAMLENSGAGILKASTVLGEKCIQVIFSDTGPGIPKEVRDRVFEPFFTTKDVGKGTGLGLSVCYGVIEDHGGRIHVEQSPEGGATMIVEIPVSTSAGDVVDKAPQTRDTAQIGNILLVDDESAIRQMLAQMLKHNGHSVDTAKDGNVALRMLKRKHYDCVLSDMKMPGMDGRQLHEAALDMDPALAGSFIFITGDTVNSDTLSYINKLDNPYLTKPFKHEDLEKVLHQVLAGKKTKNN